MTDLKLKYEKTNTIPFNKPSFLGDEISAIENAINLGKLAGDGYYTHKCNEWFYKYLNRPVLLTTSCTSALEMMAILLDIKPGDEIIMPSYTFVSTANAFVLRGAVPIFVDIREDTLNINEELVEEAITPKTKAIIAVHYAGVSCEMDKLKEIASKHNIYLLQDAAHAFSSMYKHQLLGTIGDLGTYSFHETKNIVCGEGGCIIINNENFKDRAEIIREKGTNRSKFFRGQVDKYTWVDVGSSYLPSELNTSYLYVQLENYKTIQSKRMEIWNKYYNIFEKYELEGRIRRPFIPEHCQHNAHMFYIIFNSLDERTNFIDYLKSNNIYAPFHYIPLHSSPAGEKYGRYTGNMTNTNKIGDTLVRMPLFYNLTDEELEKIILTVNKYFNRK